MNKSTPFSSGILLPAVGSISNKARSGARTTMTTFNIVLLLVVAAVVVTAYISNTFKVDKLMIRISALEKEEQALLQEQENLRADINILSSYDNIYRRAVDELHLVQSGRQPYQLIVKNLPEPEAAR